MELWKHECKRVISDRFTLPEDVVWFDQSLAKLVEEELGEEHKKMVDDGVDSYFVDFLRDAPEPTGTDHSGVVVLSCKLQLFCCVLNLLILNAFSAQGRSQRIQTLICQRCMSLLNHTRV